MRIAFLALAVVAVAFVCLKIQIAGGVRMKVPRLKLPKASRFRVPKVKISRMHMPKVKVPRAKLPRVRMPGIKSVGKAITHGATGAVNAVSQLGNTGAAIAQAVLSNQNQNNQTSSR
nr:uncharacterized protein LOC119167873 [Rhipicephalus microplus]